MGACAGAREGREGVGATRTLVGVAWVIVPEEEACATSADMFGYVTVGLSSAAAAASLKSRPQQVRACLRNSWWLHAGRKGLAGA